MRHKDNKMKKIIIAILFILIALILFLYFSSDRKKFSGDPSLQGEDAKTAEEKFEEIREKERDSFVYTFSAEAENSREWSEDDFKKMASSFAERFGTYSNHSNYENITDLRFFMSKKMKDWSENYVKDLKNNFEYSGEYYGISSKSFLSPQITNFNPKSGKVDVLVTLQRSEFFESGEDRVFDQDILITYTKEDGKWLVNSSTWK